MKWPKCYCETLTDDIRVEKMIGDDRSMLREERERERESRSLLYNRVQTISREPRRGYNTKPVELLFFYDVIIVEACALR